MDVNDNIIDIIGQDLLENHGFVHSMVTEISKGLMPGPALDNLNEKAVRNLSSFLDSAVDKDQPTATTTVDMFQWISSQIIMATTNAVYGPQNPYKDSAVRDAYL